MLFLFDSSISLSDCSRSLCGKSSTTMWRFVLLTRALIKFLKGMLEENKGINSVRINRVCINESILYKVPWCYTNESILY